MVRTVCVRGTEEVCVGAACGMSPTRRSAAYALLHADLCAKGRFEAAKAALRRRMAAAHAGLMCRSGQGTTEYAILVGVLVVIAIVAITLFRPKLEELWNAIANGINGL